MLRGRATEAERTVSKLQKEVDRLEGRVHGAHLKDERILCVVAPCYLVFVFVVVKLDIHF
jgi:hypothetical protein